MSTKWLIGLFMAFGVLTILSNTIEYYFFSDGNVTTFFSAISGFENMDIGGFGGVKIVAGDLLDAFWTALTWNYSFFSGYWEILRWVVFIPISVGLIWEIIQVLFNAISQFLNAVLPW